MMEYGRKWLVGGTIAVIALILAVLGWHYRDHFTPAEAGALAPDFQGVTTHGDTISLAQYRGQVVLLNVWATWCPPCVREMPSLQRLHEQLGSQGLRVIGINVDDVPGGFRGFNEPAGNVRSFAHDLGITFPILQDGSGHTEDLFQVFGLPTTILIGRNGHILEKIVGARPWDRPEYIAIIKRLLRS